jgi:hypothetical protein
VQPQFVVRNHLRHLDHPDAFFGMIRPYASLILRTAIWLASQ